MPLTVGDCSCDGCAGSSCSSQGYGVTPLLNASGQPLAAVESVIHVTRSRCEYVEQCFVIVVTHRAVFNLTLNT